MMADWSYDGRRKKHAVEDAPARVHIPAHLWDRKLVLSDPLSASQLFHVGRTRAPDMRLMSQRLHMTWHDGPSAEAPRRTLEFEIDAAIRTFAVPYVEPPREGEDEAARIEWEWATFLRYEQRFGYAWWIEIVCFVEGVGSENPIGGTDAESLAKLGLTAADLHRAMLTLARIWFEAHSPYAVGAAAEDARPGYYPDDLYIELLYNRQKAWPESLPEVYTAREVMAPVLAAGAGRTHRAAGARNAGAEDPA